MTAMDRDKSPIIGSSPSIDQLAAALRANDAYIAHLSNDEVDHMAFDLHAALARDISSDPVDWHPPNGAYHWEWCKRVNTRGMNAECDCGGPEAKARAEQRDISSVTGSGWDGWPERGSASREFRQRVEAMTRQVLTEKPKWSGSMCMTEAERRVLAAIQREAVALAGHRIDEDHDCLVMNCRGLGPEVERLREQIIDEQLRLGVERK